MKRDSEMISGEKRKCTVGTHAPSLWSVASINLVTQSDVGNDENFGIFFLSRYSNFLSFRARLASLLQL